MSDFNLDGSPNLWTDSTRQTRICIYCHTNHSLLNPYHCPADPSEVEYTPKPERLVKVRVNWMGEWQEHATNEETARVWHEAYGAVILEDVPEHTEAIK